MESAHIIPKAQAQGLGFASLDPILEGWKQFRNVAYLFFCNNIPSPLDF